MMDNTKNKSIIFNRPDDLRLIEPYSGFLAVCKSTHTASNYHQDLRVLNQFLNDEKIPNPIKMQPATLAKFVGHLTKPGTTPSGKPRGAYSTRTLRRILATIKSFYRYLAATQQIFNDPTIVFHTLNIRSPQRNPRPLSPTVRESLLRTLRISTSDDLKISLVVRLGYESGLRVSEIAHLTWSNINLNQHQLTVIGKGDKERIVPMTTQVHSLLNQLNIQSKTKLINLSPYVFQSPRDPQKPIHPHFLENWVKKAAHWADLENANNITVHILRHTFGTQLAESGASVYEIRDLMGHSSIVVSENYIKLASQKTRDAHQKAFGNQSKTYPLDMKHNYINPHHNLLKEFRLQLYSKEPF